MHRLLYTGVFMKKKYLTFAGIISAGILIIMFVGIFFSGSFPFLTTGTVNPLSGKNTNNTSVIGGNLTNDTISPDDINCTSSVYPQGVCPSPELQSGSCTKPSRFITIDTLPDIWMNRSYTLRGTTDLPAGEELFVTVLPLEYEVDVNPKNGSMSGMLSGAVGKVTVVNGNGSTNLWSFELQTGRMDPNTRNYFVNVSNDRFDPRFSATVSGDTFCKQRFIVKSG
jgi:hypothetical protein